MSRLPRLAAPDAPRRARACLGAPATLVLLAGCTPAAAPKPPTGDGSATVGCPAGQIADHDRCVPASCGVGPWGGRTADVYVDASAAAGDGSIDAPFPTLDEAMDAMAAGSGTVVAMAEGTYPVNLSLGVEFDGLVLAGRCADLVVWDGGAESAAALWLDGRAGRPHVTVSGVTVTNGTYGLVADGGALTVSAARVTGNLGLGIGAFAGAVVTLEDVDVSDTVEIRRELGRGLQVEDRVDLYATGLRVSGNAEVAVGVIGEGATAELRDVTIDDTRASSGSTYGYGLVVSQGARADVSGLTLTRSTGVGVLVSNPDSELTLDRAEVGDVTADATGAIGHGVEVNDAASLVASDLTVSRAAGIGLYLSDLGTTGTLAGGRVTATTPLADGAPGVGVLVTDRADLGLSEAEISGNVGWGLVVQDGATATADALVSEANQDVGILAIGADAAIVLTASRVTGTVASPGATVAVGLFADEGGQISGEDVQVDGNDGFGAGASDEGSRIALEEAVIQDTREAVDGPDGIGLVLLLGAEGTVTGGAISGSVGAGVFAAEAASLSLVDVEIADTVAGEAAGGGRGLGVESGAHVEAEGLRVERSQGGAVALGTGTLLTLVDATVVDTLSSEAEGSGTGVTAAGGAALRATGLTVAGATGGGIMASGAGSTADILDATVETTRRPANAYVATGVTAQVGGVVTLEDTRVQGNEGPGIYVAPGGRVTCERCTVTANQFAGGVAVGGSLELTESSVTDTAPDLSLGGGLGVYLSDTFGLATVTLTDTTIGPHPYAAVWADGVVDLSARDSILEGGPGTLLGSVPVGGAALVARDGAAAGDGTSGVLLEGGALRGADLVAVLLDGAGAAFLDVEWDNDGVDLVQQGCAGASLDPALYEGAEEIRICPTYDVLYDDVVAFPGLYYVDPVPAE